MEKSKSYGQYDMGAGSSYAPKKKSKARSKHQTKAAAPSAPRQGRARAETATNMVNRARDEMKGARKRVLRMGM